MLATLLWRKENLCSAVPPSLLYSIVVAAHEFGDDGPRDEPEPPPDGLRQPALHGGRQVAPEGVGDFHRAAASFVVAVRENISDATDLEQLVLRD